MFVTKKSSRVLSLLYDEASRLRLEVANWEAIRDNYAWGKDEDRTLGGFMVSVYEQLAEKVEEYIRNCMDVDSAEPPDKTEFTVTRSHGNTTL